MLDVFQAKLQSNYETQRHVTQETDDDLSVIYIMQIMLYRKHGSNTIQALQAPFKKMYTLGEFVSGKACSDKKRENACYFESTIETKPVSDGDNTVELKITIPERPFIAKEYPIGHKDDPFEKSKIESQIQNRLSKRNFPDQGGASLCGPAAFFYCLQMDRPDIYEQAARELWRYGKTKIGELEIKPGDGCRHPKGSFYNQYGSRISGLDWLTLASLRDSENIIMDYDEVSDQVPGITAWWTLSDWFEKAGYEKIFSNVGLSHCNINDLVTLGDYYNKGYHVVTLISAGMLSDFGNTETSGKNHWIVWEGVVRNYGKENITNNSDFNQYVNLNLFSWGKVEPQIKNNKSLDYVLNHVFGGLVFKPMK
ncbi:transposase [Xenorhabdus beddingii]|uniref:Transposase n=1 Tax=Xenorhabdus beddingii TaxID=40578 RepID=A0A1Y2S6Z9_9GAMM|nr:transposase [Xenorhabdus beddingii]